MAAPPSRIIPRVALVSPSTPNPGGQRRLAFSRINNIVTGLDVPNDAQADNNNNNRNNRNESFRIFISVINYNDRLDRSASADPTVANTRRIERSVSNRFAASRSRARGGARGRSARRPEREEAEEEEVDSEDDDFDFAPRRSSRRRGKCEHNHTLEKSFCSKCHIRRRHLCRWWCRQQYRRQV